MSGAPGVASIEEMLTRGPRRCDGRASPPTRVRGVRRDAGRDLPGGGHVARSHDQRRQHERQRLRRPQHRPHDRQHTRPLTFGCASIEPDELFDRVVRRQRQVRGAEAAARWGEGTLHLERLLQLGAEERGIHLPELACERRVDLQDDQERRRQAFPRFEPAERPLADAGQSRQPVLGQANEFPNATLAPAEILHPGAPYRLVDLDVPRRTVGRAASGHSRRRAPAHCKVLPSPKNCSRTTIKVPASRAWISIPRRLPRSGFRTSSWPPAAMGIRLPSTARTTPIARRSAGAWDVVVAETATRSGRRSRTSWARCSSGTFAPRYATSKPAISRKSATIRAPRSWSSPSTQATTARLPLVRRNGR